VKDRQHISMLNNQLCLGRWTSELGHLLARARVRPEGTCVPAADSGGHLILCARLLGLDETHSIFGLTLRRTDEFTREQPMGVAEAFKLTAAEAKVLQSLCQGDTAQEAAQRTGVSVETIRTHIRRIYQKVGVNSREALLTKVRPFMMVI
jgi:DNA-binding CsgD family transcriptional regulator